MAFTHSSYALEDKEKSVDYERLEFFGDSLIGFIITELLYPYHSKDEKLLSPGQLSKSKHFLVSATVLNKVASQLDLQAVVLGNFPSKTQKSNKDSKLLSDVFEAFIGALYFDLGLLASKNFVIKHLWEPYYLDSLQRTDYTSFLQEIMQKESQKLPSYSYSFQEEDKEFIASCCCNNFKTTAKGKNKKSARSNAAFLMLKKMKKLPDNA